jgi:hypothetical protein
VKAQGVFVGTDGRGRRVYLARRPLDDPEGHRIAYGDRFTRGQRSGGGQRVFPLCDLCRPIVPPIVGEREGGLWP